MLKLLFFLLFAMIRVAILDYGTGNIASLFSALNTLKVSPYLAQTSFDLNKAEALILPGVGHYGHALKNLHKNSLIKPVLDLVRSGIPILGICLGFQILTISSQEAEGINGLGLMPLETQRLQQKFPRKYKIPHIGWNSLSSTRNSKLLKDIPHNDQIFYFCNSYGVKYSNKFDGIYSEYKHENKMIALAEHNNIFGVQFHPEKSRSQGLQIINNFLSY